jgi:phage terminase large subunit-like protein
VNSGLVEDTSHLGVIYGALATDDWTDPKVWAKANPALGVTIQVEDFAREVAEARESPALLNNFLRLRLNIWTQACDRFISRESWDSCGISPILETELVGRPCYGMLDLASTTDLAALAWAFPDPNGDLSILLRFFIPIENIERREQRDQVPYPAWVRQGYIFGTPGNVIEYSFIRGQILRDSTMFDIKKLYCDPWNATQLAGQLYEQDGLPIEYLRQGYISLSGPTKELERLVMSKRLKHGNNPVLNWCCDNANAEQDAAGNIKLSKSKSIERIDGMTALVGAIAATMADPTPGESVYENRGLLFV